MRVLIVDDSRATRKFICRVVSLSGLEVTEFLQAADGEEALSVLRANPVDLVLTDINMPKMNGEQFLRAMKSEPSMCRIPVVIVSTDATDNRRARVFALGARGYVTKPVTPESLQRELDRVLLPGEAGTEVGLICPMRPTESGIEPLLNSVTLHALETMCFTSIDAVHYGSGAPEPAGTVSVQLGFGGDAVGVLGITVTQEAAATMAANFLGCEDAAEVKPDQVENFIGELANVICGSILGWCKADGHFELASPELVLVAAGDWDRQSTMTYAVEGGSIRVSLEIGLVDSLRPVT